MMWKSKNKRVLFIVGFIIVIGGIGLMLLQSKKGRETNDNSPTPEITVPPQRMSMEGEIVCLPHKDTSGPQTLECAFGLKTDEGSYYGLTTGLSSQMPPIYTTGNRIRANGLLTPPDETGEKYDIKGVFSVTDSLEVIE